MPYEVLSYAYPMPSKLHTIKTEWIIKYIDKDPDCICKLDLI